MKDIVIYGSGGLGKEVVWLIENINKSVQTWNILGFIVSDSYSELFGKQIFEYEVLGGEIWLSKYEKEIYVICAIGKGLVRKSIYERISLFQNVFIATLIDPTVRIDKSVSIGVGTIICLNSSITVDTTIGNGVLLNVNSLIGHDARIGNYCTFLPHSMAAGNTEVGECCEIGSGAFIIQGAKIVENTVIAPLSAVYKDIIKSGMYVGNPARQMK